MQIAIVKYNAGNIQSVAFALQRLGVEPLITDNKDVLLKADKVIFPGVGEASTTMQYLKEHQLDVVIKALKQPVLGICLGLQLMCAKSEEGHVDCMGIFPNLVKRFEPVLKVPHMGWNKISQLKSELLDSSIESEHVYFVHSYYAEVGNYTAATCNYINDFSAALHKDNFYATQFHPEKSGPVGEKILQNFLGL